MERCHTTMNKSRAAVSTAKKKDYFSTSKGTTRGCPTCMTVFWNNWKQVITNSKELSISCKRISYPHHNRIQIAKMFKMAKTIKTRSTKNLKSRSKNRKRSNKNRWGNKNKDRRCKLLKRLSSNANLISPPITIMRRINLLNKLPKCQLIILGIKMILKNTL